MQLLAGKKKTPLTSKTWTRRPPKTASSSSSKDILLYADDATANASRKRRTGFDIGLILFLLCGALAISFAVSQEHVMAKKRKKINDIKQILEEGVILSLEMDRTKHTSFVTHGPHKARLAIAKTSCVRPRVWMRMVGTALVSVPLEPENNDKNRWSASFSFPLDGSYRLEVRWYGCNPELTEYSSPDNSISFLVRGKNSKGSSQESRSSLTEIFPSGFWASKAIFKATQDVLSDYVWVSNNQKHLLSTAIPKLKSETALGISSLLQDESSRANSGFRDLSQQEIVCWVGSTSASLIRASFLSLRNQIDKSKRQLKFPYIPFDDFDNAESGWEDFQKNLEKCKIVIVSIDEIVDDISQADYKKQVEGILYQISKSMDDDSYPVWLMTVNSPPMSSTSSKMCHSPSRFTHNHPCNDAIFELFDKSRRNGFPSQIKLMDNTDLRDPQFGANLKDLYAVISMRVFSLISAEVKGWRRRNQTATKERFLQNVTSNQIFFKVN
jgi:hypothetical protein